MSYTSNEDDGVVSGGILGNKRRGWEFPVLLTTVILAVIMFILAILMLGGKEEDYEYLLDRRDRLQDELIKLKSMRLEGKISEKEYRRVSKRYLKEIRKIEEKLEKMEKRKKN